MKLEEINKALYEKGVEHNMCSDVRDSWVNTLDKQELIDLWYANYDFALINHYPSNSDIKKFFDKKILRENNVLVDDKWSLLNPQKAMILGDSESNIRFNAFHVGQVWVRDNSMANIYVRDNADVTVCVIDHAEVNIVNYNSTARVLVIKYSPKVSVHGTGGGIKVRENYAYLIKD